MIKEIASIFNRNITLIVMLSFSLVLPLSMFLFIAVIYIYGYAEINLKNIYALCLSILNFTLVFPPFFLLVKKDMTGEEVRFRELIKYFFDKFGFVLLTTVFLYVIALAGFFLLFIPTIISIFMLLLFPLYLEQERFGLVFKNTWKLIKQEHLFLIVDLLLIVSLYLLLWSGAFYLMSSFDNNSFVYMILRAIMNALAFPLMYFYLICKYRKDFSYNEQQLKWERGF
ncbi:hypothetical protein J9303_07505 [Bacillaceae bacterium Marseille-Q3522]|nr:hypothetical protein [Bacillaceae bacterium Marseille-Q3522]